jgi:hypothetical protein
MKRKNTDRQSEYLTQMGMRTDLRYLHLIDETQKLISFESTFSLPSSHKDQRMCSASEGGSLVKDTHLRSVPEQHDKKKRKLDTIKKIYRVTKVEVEKKLMDPPLPETELRRKYEVEGKLT